MCPFYPIKRDSHDVLLDALRDETPKLEEGSGESQEIEPPDEETAGQ